MASLIRDIMKNFDMPIFETVESAKGCEVFLFKARTEKECWKMYYDFLDTVPTNKRVKGYRIGLRPDYPVPVARYFLEVCVEDPVWMPVLSFWSRVETGRLQA